MEKIEHLWWPTPVREIKTDFNKAFNESILKEIHQSQITNQKDRNNETDIFFNIENNPELTNLTFLKRKMLETISSCARDYFPTQFYPKFAFSRAWLNVNRPGKLLKVHGHGGSLMAATYYLNTPENSGDLVLIDPLGGVNFGWTVEPGMSAGKSKSIKPEEGKLVFFPGHVLHMVEENKSQETRFSISVNITAHY